MDIAASIQNVTEKIMLMLASSLRKEYGISNLCLAGGVALNCVANGKILKEKIFDNIWVQPAAGDAGGSLGAALAYWHIDLDNTRNEINKDNMQGSYLGNQYSDDEIRNKFDEIGAKYENLIESNVIDRAVDDLTKGKAIGWFQGRMEFGPRALGNRSIIANPMLEDTRQKINSTVKRRPFYQPFCPSILEEERQRLFKNSFSHKHMAIAFRMKDEFIKDLPCAVHVDGTARPQFVEEKDNPNYYRFLKALKDITGYGVSLNTSFNLHGRTIVRTPEDAVVDFIDCNIDEMFIEGYRVKRK